MGKVGDSMGKNNQRARIIVIPHYEGKEDAKVLLKRVICDELRRKIEKSS